MANSKAGKKLLVDEEVDLVFHKLEALLKKGTWVTLNRRATKEEYGRKDIPVIPAKEREKENMKLGIRL